MSTPTEQQEPDVTTQRPRPAFLADHAGTRGLRRITPLSRPPVTGRLGEVFHVAAERAPGQRLLLDRPPDLEIDGATSRSFAEWAGFVDELAACLVAAGVQPWDRVAIYKRNHFDITALVSAAARIGAVPAPMGQWHPPEVVRTLLGRLDHPWLVTDAARLDEVGLDRDAASALLSGAIVHDGTPGRADVLDLNNLRGSPVPAPRLRADDEVMVIPHTSGTTGTPKLVLHCATSIHAQSHVETERWPVAALGSDDGVAFCDPYFHTRVMTALTVVATTTPRLLMLSGPEPELVREPLAAFVPTVFEALPNIYLSWEGLAREPSRPFRNVRLYISSFDAIHTRTIRTFLNASDRRTPLWIQSWSQSENGAMAIRPYTRGSVRRVGHRPPPNQSLGWPQPFVGKLRAVDVESGREVHRGEVGLIEVSLPGRCLGYVGEQERYRNKASGEWWNTGDLGVISRLGSVRLVDREVDRIPGASSIEIEDVLLDRLPHTTEVIVLAVPGEPPLPVVCAIGDTPIAADAWAAATADLPPMRPPVALRWDDLPRTATWKVRRNELRRRLVGVGPVGEGRWT